MRVSNCGHVAEGHLAKTAVCQHVGMVDSRDDLPLGLRPPFGGDTVFLTYRTDVGALVPVAQLAHHLIDLDTLVNLGERWGTQIARAASYPAFPHRRVAHNPTSQTRVRRPLHDNANGPELRAPAAPYSPTHSLA